MRNFGEIKNAYNSILVEGIFRKDAEKKALFQEYIKAIKNDKILKAQFQVYRNIERKVESNDTLAREYVKENIELMKKFDRKDIIEANLKLAQHIMFEQEIPESDYQHKELHEEIANLIFTEKSPKNIDSIIESTEKIVGFIKENKDVEPLKEDVVPTSVLSAIAVEKFNEKYSELSESEKTVFKSLLEGDEDVKKETYTNLVKECIELVDRRLDETEVIETQAKLLKVKDKLLRMEYVNESFITDIGKVMELKADLSDEEES